MKYENEEKNSRRNEGREVYENKILDYLLGEVVFDGKRYHVLLAVLSIVICVVLLVYVYTFKRSEKSNISIAKKKK